MNFKTDDRSLKLATGLAKNTKNSITHQKVLHTLSHYPHPDVRKAVAGNKNTRQDTLHKLSDDRYWSVRRMVAEHNNTHKDTLHKLASDFHKDVRKAAKQRLAQLTR